jgi:hypothetical protein
MIFIDKYDTMKELAVPFTIPNFEEIQSELLAAIDHDYKVNSTYAFIYSSQYMKIHCPKFMGWLMPKVKIPIRIFRYYVTPPYTTLATHIDGVNPKSPFGLNIPVTGTKNTYHSYYDTSEDNMYSDAPAGYLGAWLVKDQSKLKLLGEELEVMRPYVMNNAILHGVRNDSNEYRVMFTVRWPLHHTLFRNIEEVMDTSELLLGHA